MVVRSPLGILTASDLLGVGLVLFVVVCFTTNLTIPCFDSINHGEEIPGLEKRYRYGMEVESVYACGKCVAKSCKTLALH